MMNLSSRIRKIEERHEARRPDPVARELTPMDLHRIKRRSAQIAAHTTAEERLRLRGLEVAGRWPEACELLAELCDRPSSDAERMVNRAAHAVP